MTPSFLQKFIDLQQLPGRDAKFPCRVTGVPMPDVVWSKDGEPLKQSNKYHIKRDGDAHCLSIIECTPEDAGVYRATAINQEGQDVCTAALEVVKEMYASSDIFNYLSIHLRFLLEKHKRESNHQCSLNVLAILNYLNL